jgi:hypothetical protein
MPPNLFHIFDCLSDAALTNKSRNSYMLVWHSVIWSIWISRNNHILNNVVKEPLEIVEDMKVLSWKWSVDRLNISPCLFLCSFPTIVMSYALVIIFCFKKKKITASRDLHKILEWSAFAHNSVECICSQVTTTFTIFYFEKKFL